MTGESGVRRAEDIGGQELSYAEVKAIASGNPAVLTLAEANAELQRLTILQKNHRDEEFIARRRLRELPGFIEQLAERLTNLTTDQATANAHAADRLTINDRGCSPGDEVAVLGAYLDALPGFTSTPRRFPLGVYHGLRFGIVLHPQFAPDVYVEGKATRQSLLSREHHGPRAVLNAVERLVGGCRLECERVEQDLAIAEGQLRDYRERLGRPFEHETYLDELARLREVADGGPIPRSPRRPTLDRLYGRRQKHVTRNLVERISIKLDVNGECR